MNNCQSALDDLKDIVEGISKLRDAAYVKYSELVRQVLENQITDEQQLEQIMDGLCDFCNESRFIDLYRSLCRHIYYQYPELVGEHVITDIQFLNNEQQPEVKTERGLIYDIYCRTNTGEHIIVEMQNREQPYIKDRALFYLSRAITQQARKGIWNFSIVSSGRFLLNCRTLIKKRMNVKMILNAGFIY